MERRRPTPTWSTTQAIGERYAANAAGAGPHVRPPSPARRVVGSTDMGNVSYVVPSIHPMIQVAPPGVAIHTPDFAGYAGGPEGDAAVIDGAKALALTVADLWLDAGLVGLARAEWEAAVGTRERPAGPGDRADGPPRRRRCRWRQHPPGRIAAVRSASL